MSLRGHMNGVKVRILLQAFVQVDRFSLKELKRQFLVK